MFHPTEHSYAKKKKSKILDLALFISDRQKYSPKIIFCRSVDGNICAFLPPATETGSQLRKLVINSKSKLEQFLSAEHCFRMLCTAKYFTCQSIIYYCICVVNGKLRS